MAEGRQESEWAQTENNTHWTWRTWNKESLPREAINLTIRPKRKDFEDSRESMADFLDGAFGIPTKWSNE